MLPIFSFNNFFSFSSSLKLLALSAVLFSSSLSYRLAFWKSCWSSFSITLDSLFFSLSSANSAQPFSFFISDSIVFASASAVAALSSAALAVLRSFISSKSLSDIPSESIRTLPAISFPFGTTLIFIDPNSSRSGKLSFKEAPNSFTVFKPSTSAYIFCKAVKAILGELPTWFIILDT